MLADSFRQEAFRSLRNTPHIAQNFTQNIVQIDMFADFGKFPFGVNKEAAGIHDLLTRSLFACEILHRLLRRVSLAKPTFALLRF